MTERIEVEVSRVYSVEGPIPIQMDEYIISSEDRSINTSVLKGSDNHWVLPVGPKGPSIVTYFTSLEDAVAYIDSVN